MGGSLPGVYTKPVFAFTFRVSDEPCQIRFKESLDTVLKRYYVSAKTNKQRGHDG